MPRTQGYLLPDGELGEDEIACTFVFYPDRPEYRAALQGSLAYLATWIAWEKDAGKRGKDAAANWQEAYELTTECWRMGCLEQLQDDVSDILDFLRNKKDCCDDNLTYGPGTEHDTDIVPFAGDEPDYYGETAITDWDDWAEHVCYNANLWVDELIRQAETVETGLATGAIAVGLVAGTLAVIGFLATGGVLSIPIMMAISAALAAGGASSSFATAATDLETAREDIVCSLILGGDVAQEIEDALSIAAAWTLYYQHADYDTASAIIHEGGQGTVYLPTETSEACDCYSSAGSKMFTWNATQENWSPLSRTDRALPSSKSIPGTNHDAQAFCFNAKSSGGNASAKITGNNLRTELGLLTSDTVYGRKVSAYIWCAALTDKDMIVRIRFDDATFEDHDPGTLSTTPTYYEFDIVDDAKDLETGAGAYAIELVSSHNGESGDEHVFVDDFTIFWLSP